MTDKEATATEAGSRHEECDVCGFAKAAVEIPATGTTADTGKNDSPNAPETGDHNSYLLWFVILAVSGSVLAGTAVYRRGRNIR